MRTLLSLGMVLVATLSAPAQRLVLVNPTNNAVLVPPATAFWSSNRLAIVAALSLDTEINGGEPNGAGATIHWSQLLGVPELGGGGGGEGESNFIASVTADFEVLSRQLSLTNAAGTGALVRTSVLDGYVTSAAAASLYQPLDPALTALAQGDGSALTNLPSGGGGMTIVSNWFARTAAAGTNVAVLPQPVAAATASTWAPDFGAGRVHQVTMSGNLTLSAPTGTTDDMLGQTFLLILVQDSTGGRSVTPATNYLSGLEVTGLGVSTNAGSRSYVTVLLRRTNVLDVLGSLSGYAP